MFMKLPRPSKTVLREALASVILLLGVFGFRSSIAEPYEVPTGSMEPTILPGDRLVVLKSVYQLHLPFTDIGLTRFSEPKRGDIIVFRFPEDPSINFVKRLIGLPGDVVEVTDDLIRINGKELEVSPVHPPELFMEAIDTSRHLFQRTRTETLTAVTQRFVVPAGHYFFMGDNRDNSNDSRFWGFVPKAYLKGKAVAIWMSFDSSKGGLPEVRWNRIGKTLQ